MITLASAFFAMCTMMSVPNFHAIYISVLEFDNQELKVKLFTDDLQDAIRNFSEDFKPGENNSFLQQNEGIIEAYFNQKINLKINGQQIRVKFQQGTVEGDSYWITFGLGNVGEWKTLSLSDTHFMELFPNQQNIVKVMGEKPRFCKLNSQNKNCSFNF